MDFSTGKNVVVFDNRIKAKINNVAAYCKPPKAWKVVKARFLKLDQIVNEIKKNLDQTQTAKADCLYIICHGFPAHLQLGLDNVGWNNTEQFKALENRFEKVIVIACSVAENHPARNAEETYANGVSHIRHYYAWQMLQKVSNNLNAPVKAGQEIQYYSWDTKTLEFQFNKWNGTIVNIFPNGVAIEGGSTE